MVFTSIDLSLAPSNQTNILDNGGFEIWQRGTSFTNPANSTVPTADRWYPYKNVSGAPTANISQSSSVVVSGLYSLEISISAIGTSSFEYIAQDIEVYQAYAGKTITLSVRVNTTLANVAAGIQDSAGTLYSSVHPGDGIYHTLTVTKTISSSTTFLTIIIGCTSIVATGNIYIDSAMLVTGANAGTFVSLHPAIDLVRCQRYYEAQHFPETVVPVLKPASGGGNAIWQFVPFQVQKRVAPTVTSTLVSVVISAVGGQTGGDSADTGAWSMSGSAQSFVGGASVELTRATDGGLASALIEFTWTASADV